MFPLFTNRMPATAAELQQALNETFERLFTRVTAPASVRDESYPRVAEIRVNLDRAELRPNPPRPPVTLGTTKAALEVNALTISANEIAVGPAEVNLQVRASGAQLHEMRDGEDKILLVVHRAESGEVEISARKTDLENALSAVARNQAGKQGITIDQVQLTLASRGERGLDAEVRLRAKKMFFSTTVRIAAKLDLDDELNARLSGLSCNGEGAIGAVACGVLQPHIEKLEGRSFSLMALPLGELRLHDLRIATGDQINITAEFGS